MDYNTLGGGISASNRIRLSELHRKMRTPFTVADAARALDIDPARSRRFLAYLAGRGWLVRVRRDLYVTVPLDASSPSEWREDPWIVASRSFEPCYIAGWSAAEHWELTEQVFRDLLVVTTRPIRDRHPNIQGTDFHIRVVSEDKLFGTETVWRREAKVLVSDPSRTVVDILDEPALGGGIRHCAEIVATYLTGPLRNDSRLLEYARRLGNRTVYKRLGYLIEALGLEAPQLVQTCATEQSSGFSLLDPTMPSRGRFLRRWNLRINAHVASCKSEE